MKPLIIKFGPTGAVAAMTAFCLWPWLFGEPSGPGGAEPPKMPEIAPAMLSPRMAAQSERDPFRPHDASPIAEQQAGRPATSAAAATGQGRTAATSVTAKSQDRATETDAGPLPGLLLKGTSMHGRQRLALINGKLYAEGDTLTADESSESNFRISRIFRYKVVLKSTDRELELTYSDVAEPIGAQTAGKVKKPEPDSARTAGPQPPRDTPSPGNARCPPGQGHDPHRRTDQ